MFFKTRDGSLKDPEIQALKLTIDRFMLGNWSIPEIRLHATEDITIEAWFQGLVQFLNEEEWNELMAQVEEERKKSTPYIV